MSSKVAQVFQSLKPHIPMIRFRKGGNPASQASSPPRAASVPQLVQPAVPANASIWTPTTVASLEWYEVPIRYKRRSIDEAECDMINMGGAEKIFS